MKHLIRAVAFFVGIAVASATAICADQPNSPTQAPGAPGLIAGVCPRIWSFTQIDKTDTYALVFTTKRSTQIDANIDIYRGEHVYEIGFPAIPIQTFTDVRIAPYRSSAIVLRIPEASQPLSIVASFPNAPKACTDDARDFLQKDVGNPTPTVLVSQFFELRRSIAIEASAATPHEIFPSTLSAPTCALPHRDASATKTAILDYPEIARRQGQVGLAKVLVVLDTSGNVIDSAVYQSTGNRTLDDAADKSARLSRFSPETSACVTHVGQYIFQALFGGDGAPPTY